MKPTRPFHFKQFSVHQDKCAMKVTLDACAFGALAEVEHAHRILDIGTGTGLLALMAAQRTQADINAVEIHTDAFIQARENIAASPFSQQISVHQGDIRTFEPNQTYDCILSNPPFFSQSLKGPNSARNLARHNDGLSFDELSFTLNRLLAPQGICWILLPIQEIDSFLLSATQRALSLTKRIQLQATPDKPPHRSVLVLSKRESSEPDIQGLTLCHSDGTYTAEFSQLMQPYYLKL